MGRFGGSGAAILGALMLVAAPAAAKCVPSTFKDGWLQEQERLGGDTMDRHVGRNATELVAYLSRDPDVSATSSFPDPNTARQVISAALLPGLLAAAGYVLAIYAVARLSDAAGRPTVRAMAIWNGRAAAILRSR